MTDQVRASIACDKLLAGDANLTDVVVSRGLVHGCFEVDGQWFELKIQPILDEEVDEFWPDARRREG